MNTDQINIYYGQLFSLFDGEKEKQKSKEKEEGRRGRLSDDAAAGVGVFFACAIDSATLGLHDQIVITWHSSSIAMAAYLSVST